MTPLLNLHRKPSARARACTHPPEQASLFVFSVSCCQGTRPRRASARCVSVEARHSTHHRHSNSAPSTRQVSHAARAQQPHGGGPSGSVSACAACLSRQCAKAGEGLRCWLQPAAGALAVVRRPAQQPTAAHSHSSPQPQQPTATAAHSSRPHVPPSTAPPAPPCAPRSVCRTCREGRAVRQRLARRA
jgi:hypothetical protein